MPRGVRCPQGEHLMGKFREDCGRGRHRFPKFLAAVATQDGQANLAVSSGVPETTSALLQAGHSARHNSFPSDHYSMRVAQIRRSAQLTKIMTLR